MGAVETPAKSPPTPELLLRLRRPAEAQVSPDGTTVAFTVASSADDASSRPQSRLWLASEGEAREATCGPGRDARPRWSPDGRALAYGSAGADRRRTAVRVLGQTDPVAEIAGTVADLRWLTDGRALLVLADEGDEPAAEAGSIRVRRPSGPSRRLYRLELASGECAEVGPAGLTVWEVSPGNGDSAAALVSTEPTESGWYSASVAVLDLGGRKAHPLYTPVWQVSTPRFSSDGERVAFLEGICSDRGVLAGVATIVEVDSGELRRPAPELDLSDLAWLDDWSLLCTGWKGMECVCGVLSLDGSWRELWSGEATLGSGGRPAVSASADGNTLVAIKQSLEEPPEVMRLETNRPQAGWLSLTRLNADVAAEIELPRWQRLDWRAADGLEIEGLLARPHGDAHEPLPLVVCVHGGPSGQWAYQFLHPFGHPVLMAARGYAVLLPNPRGSTGRGQVFARATVGDIGGAELGDILAGVDACVAAGIADPQRVGISGGSHGGYMAAWAVTQTDRFAASVPWASVSNLMSAHYGSNIAGFDDVFMGVRPHESARLYVDRSPVAHAYRCTTPTLIVHGQEDPYCPIGQAEELYNALVAAGVEVELVVYPREGHGWSEREHVLDFWERYRGWFDRHLGLGEAGRPAG